MRARATPGIAAEVAVCSRLDPSDIAGGGRRAAAEHGVELVVVGPEAPLVAGLADALAAAGIRLLRPGGGGRRAGGLQGVLQGGDGRGRRADRRLHGRDRRRGGHGRDRRATRSVIKADGLAAGKGVIIAADEAEARAALTTCSSSTASGPSGWSSRSTWTARSCRCWRCATARRAVPLASAQDYKRIFDGDEGPNTGGMGSYSPVPGVGRRARAARSAPRSTSRCSTSSRAAGSPFHGVLYAGLMMTADGAARCWSSTCASAIPRRRRSCRGCGPTCSSC